jgi:hypothetical protein
MEAEVLDRVAALIRRCPWGEYRQARAAMVQSRRPVVPGRVKPDPVGFGERVVTAAHWVEVDFNPQGRPKGRRPC